MKATRVLLILGLLGFITYQDTSGQGQQQTIQFSGVVVGGKQSELLPQAYVYIPRAGRGTVTNSSGFFTMPVFPGDSIVFSYVGYQKQFFVMPRGFREDNYSAKIQLREDAIALREVKIYPFRSRKEFDDAFLAMTLADAREREVLARNTDPDYIRRMGIMMGGAGSNASFRESQRMLLDAQNNRGFATTMPFFNPFAWANFIRSVKKGDLKDNSWKELYKDAPTVNTNRDWYIRQQQKQ